MSTREMAYNIFLRLSEEQLKEFIAMFREQYPIEDEDQQRRSVPDFDEEKELEEYRKERYSV